MRSYDQKRRSRIERGMRKKEGDAVSSHRCSEHASPDESETGSAAALPNLLTVSSTPGVATKLPDALPILGFDHTCAQEVEVPPEAVRTCEEIAESALSRTQEMLLQLSALGLDTQDSKEEADVDVATLQAAFNVSRSWRTEEDDYVEVPKEFVRMLNQLWSKRHALQNVGGLENSAAPLVSPTSLRGSDTSPSQPASPNGKSTQFPSRPPPLASPGSSCGSDICSMSQFASSDERCTPLFARPVLLFSPKSPGGSDTCPSQVGSLVGNSAPLPSRPAPQVIQSSPRTLPRTPSTATCSPPVTIASPVAMPASTVQAPSRWPPLIHSRCTVGQTAKPVAVVQTLTITSTWVVH